VTLGAKGRDTSAAAAVAAAGALAGAADAAFAGAALAAFFAVRFFGALFRAFFFPTLRRGADFFALFCFFLPADFLRADFLRAPLFLRADFFPRFAGFRAARLRLLFLRAAMCCLPPTPGGAVAARILRSPLACLPCKSR